MERVRVRPTRFFRPVLEKRFTSGSDVTHARLGSYPSHDRARRRVRGGEHRLCAHLLGPQKPTPEKLAPYECGMPPVGDARERHPVKFYLVAMIFLLFDIEVAFLYPLAMALRELRLGRLHPAGRCSSLILLAGYVYVWRKGVLDWGHERR